MSYGKHAVRSARVRRSGLACEYVVSELFEENCFDMLAQHVADRIRASGSNRSPHQRCHPENFPRLWNSGLSFCTVAFALACGFHQL